MINMLIEKADDNIRKKFTNSNIKLIYIISNTQSLQAKITMKY